MELIKLNPQEYQLPDDIASNISNQFKPMLDKMVELEQEFNEVVALPIESEETSKKAKELRLKYVKVRTGTSEIHKQQKAFYLNGGRFVDGWKNAQVFASQGKEEKLAEIEKYMENLEKERMDAIHNERIEQLKPYMAQLPDLYFGNMEYDVWLAYLGAKKKTHDDLMEAERVAREQKEKEQRILNLHNERREDLIKSGLYQFLDNQNALMNFGTLSDKYYDGFVYDLKNRKAKQEEEQELLRKQKLEAEAKLKAEMEQRQKEREAMLEANRKAEATMLEEKRKAEAEAMRLRIEIEKKRKEEEEIEKQKQIQEDKARREAIKLAKAPIKKQLKVWLSEFNAPNHIPDHHVAEVIMKKYESFINWCNQQIEEI